MIRIRDLYKSFQERTVINGISEEIDQGEFFTIIGPSGQGKSTILRIINGLETPTKGSVEIDGINLHSIGSVRLSVRKRMGMVFQNPVAFNETVYENIAIGLRFRKMRESEIRLRVREKLDEIDLSGFEKRRAGTLSGGEKQRIALARIMITEPDILILDEPTANLDPISAANIEELIMHYHKDEDTTVLMATHDLYEGQRLSDRIAVMMDGSFIQAKDPLALFSKPCCAEVARFIGIRNILPGEIKRYEDGMAVVRTGPLIIHGFSDLPASSSVSVGIRPEEITLHRDTDRMTSARNVIKGTVKEIRPWGVISLVITDCDGIELAAQVTIRSIEELKIKNGADVILSFKAPAVHIMAEDTASLRSGPSHNLPPP